MGEKQHSIAAKRTNKKKIVGGSFWRSGGACVLLFGVVAFVFLIVNVVLVYPGQYVPDSTSQMCQVVSDCELDDWHPLAMVYVWKWLYAMTGNIASLLVVQLVLLYAALFVLAALIYRRTRSVVLSVSVFAFALLPNVLNLSGTIVKDSQMAISLLVAFALALWMADLPRKWQKTRIVLYVVSCVFMVYAALVRANALVAVVPIVFLSSYWLFSATVVERRFGKKGLIVGSCCMALCVAACSFVGSGAIRAVSGVKENSSSVTMYLLDIVNVANLDEIRSMNIENAQLRELLIQMAESEAGCSHFVDPSFTNVALWMCMADMSYPKDMSSLQGVWKEIVMKHPKAYVFYKLDTYSHFLFADDNQYAIFIQTDYANVGRVMGNKAELVTYTPPSLVLALKKYVLDFGYRYFPFMYKAWFWLAMSVGILVYAIRKRSAYKAIYIALSVSAGLYVLSYAIGNLTSDYRYVYWSAIACMLCVFLMVIERWRSKKIQKEPGGKAKTTKVSKVGKVEIGPMRILKELIAYGVVSVVALVVDASGLVLLEKVGVNVVLAASISFLAGLMVNFIMSKKFVFKEKASVGNKYGEFIVFGVIGLIGLGMNAGIMWICSDLWGWHFLIAKGLSVVIVFFWNFFLRKLLLYR